GHEGWVKLWNAHTGEERKTFDGPNKIEVTSVAFLPDSKQLAVADAKGTYLCDVSGATPAYVAWGWDQGPRSLPDADGGMRGLTFASKGQLLVGFVGLPRGEGEVRVWDLSENKVPRLRNR